MEKYDVIIAGGGVSGIAAAYTAAKNGLKTLIIEKEAFLGGSITSSLVIPAMKTCEHLKSPFLDDLLVKLKKYNAQITFPMNNNNFWMEPELCKIVFEEMLNDVNCTIFYNSLINSVYKSNDKLISLGIIPTNYDINNIKHFKTDFTLLDYKNEDDILSLYINKTHSDKIKKETIQNINKFNREFKQDDYHKNCCESLKMFLSQYFNTQNFKIPQNYKLSLSSCLNEEMKENKFLSVYIDKSHDALIKKYTTKNIKIEADYFIDATSDGALSLISGCKNINKENKHQYSTLRFIVENVDVKRLAKYIKKHRKSETDEPVYKIKNDIHLSTAYTFDTKEKWSLNKVFDKALKNNLLTKEDLAYFQIFTVANRKNAIAFNCPRIYQNNDTIKNKSLALIEGRKRLYKLFSFCKENIEGFKNSYISEIANSLGVRVSNMIEGEYIYTKDDMISSKRFKNEVLESEYPIDIHDKNSTIEPKNTTYFLPIESIKSKDIKNLYVVGRCLSADFEAQSALRVQISAFQTGEAASMDIVKNLT